MKYLSSKEIGSEYCNRDFYIDFCRAAAFILVVMHHSGIGRLGEYILGFHMPVFFIITGFTFKIIKVENQPLYFFSVKRCKQLIVPYFIFEGINYVLSRFMGVILKNRFKTPVLPALKSIVLCINNEEYIGISLRLWFLPCMALSSIVFVLILHIDKWKNKSLVVFLTAIVSLICSYIVASCLKYRIPFTIDISMLALFYISLGYLVKELIYSLRGWNIYIKFFLSIVALVCYVSVINMNDGHFYMYENEYGNYFVAILGSVIGSFCFFLFMDIFFSLIRNSVVLNCISQWINQNSVIMFPIHLEVLFFVGIINKFIPWGGLPCVFKTLLVFALMAPIIYVINIVRVYSDRLISSTRNN